MNSKHNKIAIVCDFDDTLCHDSTTECLKMLGVDTDKFWNEEVLGLMQNGWDPVPAYFYKMVELYARFGIALTKEVFIKSAASLIFYPGVIDFWKNIRDELKSDAPDWDIEFYLISSGISDIVANSRIANEFSDIWAGEFYYNNEGRIDFPKRIVSFTDKTRYLFQISKGMVGEDSRSEPFDVNKKLAFENIHIPFKNMIYLGDGYTDVPCFALLKKYGGLPIAVYDKNKTSGIKKAMHLHADNRVVDYADTNYERGSALYERIVDCMREIKRKNQDAVDNML